MVRCGSKNRYQKHVFQRDWTTCSNNDNHFRLNSQHNWGGPTWPFHEHKNLHFDNEWDIHMSSENHEESNYGLNLDLLSISYLLSVSYPRRSGLVRKVIIQDPSTLDWSTVDNWAPWNVGCMCSSYHRQAARFLINLHSLVESNHIGESNFMETVQIMFCCGRSSFTPRSARSWKIWASTVTL